MKYLITIPASITKGKHPKLVHGSYRITEAFNIEQAKRRAAGFMGVPFSKEPTLVTIEPLDEWIAKIDTI